MIFRFAAIFILYLSAQNAFSQLSNKKCKWISHFDRQVFLDSLSIDPNTISVSDFPDSLFDFHYNLDAGTITINKTGDKVDSVQICYRVFPVSLYRVNYRRSLSEYDSNAFFKDKPVDPQLFDFRNELFHSQDLQKSGSISRSISFGNTQDIFVNSQLNLQLDGKLTDDVNIRAVISDQNIPFQPEGNTQQLQEFDKVFIELYNEHGSLTAGDVVLQHKSENGKPVSHFLRYYKNVQGGELKTRYNLTEASRAETTLGVSVAKGQFASVKLNVIEGVSGPYKLTGPDNRRFVIVLANSEKVFLDGKLLVRGFDQDYTIDYNLGEITFTNRVLITKFSRVRVDFEFSDQNYSRSIVAATHYQQMGNASIYANYYAEKDNPNRTLTFDPSQEEINALADIGDNIEQAVISGADSIGFSQNQILYKKTDTLDAGGKFYVIFKHSLDPDSAFFRVTFSEVGFGGGNYVLDRINANGRIYRWVAPVNGQPQGNFAPVSSVPLPNKKQMFTIGTNYHVNEHEEAFAELALSGQDVNLFSQIGDDDNQGQAAKAGFKSSGRPVNFLTGYEWNGGVDFEWNDANFNPIDRYRFIEFDRDWSFDPRTEDPPSDDNILNFQWGLQKDLNNRFNYRIAHRKRGKLVDGNQHHLDFAQRFGKMQLLSDAFILKNDQDERVSQWKRLNAEAYWDLPFFVPGYVYSIDRNSIRKNESDSVISSANNFSEHKFYLRSGDSLNTEFNINYSIREDMAPFSGELKKNNLARTVNLFLSSQANPTNRFNLYFTYRDIENFNKSDSLPHEETVMGRMDWISQLFDRHIRSELTYSISNSRELRREFVFLPVTPGEGTHTWRDNDGDGEQDLDEFFEAINLDERDFIKVFVPTDEFVLAFNNLFNYRLNLRAPRSWRSRGGLASVLSRFSNNTSITMDKKTTDSGVAARFNPFHSLDEEDLISNRSSLRTTLFFNRTGPKYGLDLSLFQTEFKQLLTNGFETRKNEDISIIMRYNIIKMYDLRLKTKTFSIDNSSDFLNRNFSIAGYSFSPEVSLQPSQYLRLTGNYKFTQKEDKLTPDEPSSARSDEFALNLRIAKATKSNFSATLRYIKIDFTGEENTALGYELLEALRPGTNVTWSLNWQRQILSGLQMTLNYDGRKSEENTAVHFARMQVSALF